jgi:hypothetical protein
MLCHYKCHYIDRPEAGCQDGNIAAVTRRNRRLNFSQHSFFGNTAQVDCPEAVRQDAPFHNDQSPKGRSNPMNNTNAKAGTLALYAITFLSLLVNIPGGGILQTLVAIILIAHVVEVLAFQKQIRLHQGPLIDSIGLTLLFGFIHWKPLADKAARDGNA